MTKTYWERTKGHVTSSKLKDFLKCEYLYYLKWEKGLAEDEESTDAFEFGNLLDAFVTLGEEEFWKIYTILPPKAHRTSEFEIKNSDGEKLKQMIEEAKRQPLFMGTAEYKHQEEIRCEYKGLKLLGTLDRYSKEKAVIRDTKSCRSHTGEFHYSDSFNNQAFQFDYPFSMAFYSILAEIRDGVKCQVGLDAFAKNNGLYHFYVVPEDILRSEKHIIIEALDRLSKKKEEKDFECEADSDKCLRCPLATSCKRTVQIDPDYLETPENKY